MPRSEYKPPSRSPPSRPKTPGVLIVYRVLLALALLLVLVILGGTIYALVFRPKAAAAQSPQIPPPVSSPVSEANIFTGLGRLRCPTAGANPGMVILQAAFPYNRGDRAFSEELASRLRELRNISAAYFAALTVEELGRKDEAEVKTELLARYNGVLRLGRIETLYFNEYMVIE